MCYHITTIQIYIASGLHATKTSTCLEGMFDGDLYIVEGEKKAAAVFKYWKLPNVVGIGGCWNAVRTIEASGAYKLIDRLHLLITPGRKIKVILDSDVI